MLVRCVHNKMNFVDAQSAIGQKLRQTVSTDTDAFDVTVGSFYTVYAIAIREGVPWFFIADDLYEVLSYPLAYASVLFDETDNRVSSCWEVVVQVKDSNCEVIIAFKEWVNDANFFEHLIDGSDLEVQIFRRYKAFMDIEYPSPSITNKAELIGDAWFMCPICAEAWESESKLGMIRCPKCFTCLLNPRYSGGSRKGTQLFSID